MSAKNAMVFCAGGGSGNSEHFGWVTGLGVSGRAGHDRSFNMGSQRAEANERGGIAIDA